MGLPKFVMKNGVMALLKPLDGPGYICLRGTNRG